MREGERESRGGRSWQALPATALAPIPAHPRCPATANWCDACPREAEERGVCDEGSIEGDLVAAAVCGQQGAPE